VRLSSARSAFEQLLLPAECLLCHGLLHGAETTSIVGAVCRQRWRAVRPPWCERCGQPEPHFGPCRLCSEWPHALKTVRSAVWLADGARDAVHALKYRHLPRLADDLAAAMSASRPPADGTSVLLPIPLAAKRLRARGYNQAEALADALGRRWEMPVLRNVLLRVRETPTQTALTPQTRLANVAGAFETRNVERGTRNDASGLSSAFRLPRSALILVDDVFTTGATLAEAARALEQAGAQSIHGVTFARAAIPDFT
jgi:ComF family protein